MGWDGEDEMVGSPGPVSRVGTDGDIETCQIVWVGKGHRSDLASIQLPDICDVASEASV